jgi:hypothetical protein
VEVDNSLQNPGPCDLSHSLSLQFIYSLQVDNLSNGPEDVHPMRAIDLMREYHLLKEPRIDEEKYDIDTLEFTEEEGA